MYALIVLALRNLAGQPLRALLTALAISLGVAMVLAAAVIGQAASAGAAQLTADRPGVDLEILTRAGQPYDAGLLDTVRAWPAVEQASPALHLKADVQPIGELTLIGVDPVAYQALHRPPVANGAFLAGPDSLVLPMAAALDHNLNVGDGLIASTPAQTIHLRVGGRLALEQDIQRWADQTTAFVPLAVAQELWGRGGASPAVIDQVEVALRPGTDLNQARVELAQAVGRAWVVTPAVPDHRLAPAGNTLMVQAGLAMVGLVILFAASFVILNAFGMSVTARTREIGALRALGMTRRQVMRLVLVEAGLLGLSGVVGGGLLGLGLAWGVMRVMGALDKAPLIVPAWGTALSAGLGLAVTLAAALQPAWRASRTPPIVAVRPESGNTGPMRNRSACGSLIRLALVMASIAAFGLLARPALFVALPAVGLGEAALLGASLLLIPALVAPVNAVCRPALVRWLGAAGRLASDNVNRNPARAALTAAAMTAGLTILVATSGLMTAGLKGALGRLGLMLHENTFITVDISSVITSGEMSVENFFQYISENPNFDLQPVMDALDPLVQAGVIQVERCRFAPAPPGLGSLPGAPVIFVDAELFLRMGNFEFYQGDPQTALELMQRGRAVLAPPSVAERLGVSVGDSFPLQTSQGELPFTLAGIGGNGWMMTVLPYTDGQSYFDIAAPTHLGVFVTSGQDVATALSRVRRALEPFPTMGMSADYAGVFDPLMEMVDRLALLLNALVLLAVVVAALGVVNTMAANSFERGREIAVLRAVGATQRQVRQAVMAEAAVLGLLAALTADGLGLLMLLTFGVLILPNGVSSIGVQADWQTIQMTLGAGLRDWGLAALAALIFGPAAAALAAYYPARRAAAMNVVEAARSEQVGLGRASVKRRASGAGHPLTGASPVALSPVWRNSRRRLGLGVALSMLAGLAGLVAVLAERDRRYFEQKMFDVTYQMTNLNVGLIELSLPPHVHNLDWSALRAGGAWGSDQSLSQFKTFKKQLQDNGILDFTVADRDGIVLINLDTKAVGQVAPPLPASGQAGLFSKDKKGRWVMRAAAPIHNKDGLLVGSVRITLEARQAQALQAWLWYRLGGLGLALVGVGVLIGLALSRPLAHRAYMLLQRSPPSERAAGRCAALFLQATLTLALATLMAAMVGALGLFAIPIQGRYVEGMLKDTMAARLEWAAHAVSNNPEVSLPSLLRGQTPSPLEAMQQAQAFDLERLQALADRARGQDIAYVALVNARGEIVLSDQLALMDTLDEGRAGAPGDRLVRDDLWHDEAVWLFSTPLRPGDDGKPLGVLLAAMYRRPLDEFLNQSRSLFLTAGLAAVLVGVLTAQVIGLAMVYDVLWG